MAIPAPGPPAHQRARGTLRLSFKQRGPGTVLDGLRQEGCLKARFPRPEPGAWPGAVTLNTAGGIAAGDILDSTIAAGPGTQATVAAQAAERIYRALPGATPAAVTTRLTIAPGGALEWLPQETILFDACAIQRRLLIDMAEDAHLLAVESLVFGRISSGESVHSARIRDLIQLRRAGRLVLHDTIRLDGPVQAVLDHRATGNGARATATLLLAAPDAAARLDPLRQALHGHDAGASAWDGILVARIAAANGACLRRAVVAGLNVLRDGRPLPRVWEC